MISEKNLSVIWRQVDPWLYKNDQLHYKGILFDLLKYLSNSLNFTYNLMESFEYGSFIKRNNSWSGMKDQLERNVILKVE